MQELAAISPAVAQLNPTHPYQVPQGYFDQLPEQLMQRVKALPAQTPTPYAVPLNYFEELPGILLQKVKSAGADLPGVELEEIAPFLNSLPKTNPYTVPTGYFAELPTHTSDGAQAIALVNETLENLSPLLGGLRQKQVYQVPEQYFNTLPAQLLKAAKAGNTATLITIGFRKKIFRYAAAAAIAGLLLTGYFLYRNSSSPGTPDQIATTAEKVRQEVSDEELQRYLESEYLPTTESVASETAETSIDMKEMLADISDEELQKYVERTTGNSYSVIN